MTGKCQELSSRLSAALRVARGAARCAVLCVTLVSAASLVHAGTSTVSIHDIQSTVDSSGGSLYAGQEVTISGTVTATQYFGYTVAEAPGPWNAISVYSWTEGPAVGDEVQLTGIVDEYFGMTEIGVVLDYQLLSVGNPVPSTVVTLAEVSQEPYESVLVTVEDVTVAALLAWGEWAVMDTSLDFALCDVLNDYMYFPGVGDHLASLTGVLFYTYGTFKIEPRSTQDIVGEVIPHYALFGHVVTMNDEREVLAKSYVEIEGDEIVAIHPRRPLGIPVISTGGLIFPGLIDSHNHPGYNVLGAIPFSTTFEDRYEWRDDPMYDDFGAQMSSIRHHGGYYAQEPNLRKFAEIRALTAGTTSIQGANCYGYDADYFAHQGIIVDNVERFPARALHDTFPLWSDQGNWAVTSDEYWDRFIVHLAEGINDEALEEFHTWRSWGMLDERTTVVHGVALQGPEWSAMAAVGANLVWSPQSNLVLYGRTANIPAALAAGVNVALAPDWTESGSRHLLDELRVADDLDNEQWGDVITPLQLAEFVTRNAARAVGSEERIGQIAPGFRANLMVIPGSPNRPYDALLRAEQASVKLTVVSGKPMYGNPDIMAKFGFLEGCETVFLGGEEKTLAIRVDSHNIPEASKSLADIQAELRAAYDASSPKVCEFVGLDD